MFGDTEFEKNNFNTIRYFFERRRYSERISI